MKQHQYLIPDYKRPSCHYCQGRGFSVMEKYDRGKEVPRSEVIECVHCGGTGLVFKSRD